jgi:hypothetical protein
MLRSQLPLLSLVGNSFSIRTVPGLLLLNNVTTPLEVEETVLRAGNLTFTVTMAGEGWSERNLEDCFTAVVAGWTSQSSLSEPSGWKNNEVRNSILGTNVSVVFQRISRRTVRFRQLNASLYDIRRQENLFLTVPALCAESGQAPRGSLSIRVLPQNGILTTSFFSRSGQVPVDVPVRRPTNFGRPGMIITSSNVASGMAIGNRSGRESFQTPHLREYVHK